MGRTYAGILALLAFLVVMARSAMTGGGAETTLAAASLSLVVFATIGYLVGWTAERTVHESVAAIVAAELAASEAVAKRTASGESGPAAGER